MARRKHVYFSCSRLDGAVPDGRRLGSTWSVRLSACFHSVALLSLRDSSSAAGSKLGLRRPWPSSWKGELTQHLKALMTSLGSRCYVAAPGSQGSRDMGCPAGRLSGDKERKDFIEHLAVLIQGSDPHRRHPLPLPPSKEGK